LEKEAKRDDIGDVAGVKAAAVETFAAAIYCDV